MKITLLGSSAFKEKKLEYRDQLVSMGHEVFIHPDYEAFVRGEKQDLWRQITGGEHHQAKRTQGYIKWYYDAICKSDCVFVVNLEKKGIRNYIGGNVLMEIAFAYVNDKKIFLLNPIPEEVSYVDELKAMVEDVIYGDLEKIK